MPDEKTQSGILKIPGFDKPKTSQEPPPLRPRNPMRTPEELTPLATQIASNLEFMKKFREVMGSGDEDRARAMVDEVRHFAQTLDPTVTYAEGARITLVLMTIIRDQSGDRNG